ncbi:MAG: D-alanyl-D-alanine carboxypeptidase/D-alanyl-D-alanine-endopeptidase [Proteobacteria bacterium]|nr:D-alanyl-D-alanine carboxypeptidase/D-alanyl-D-alanine-endopeptidase [Pseudomonadota bacterium]
MNRFLLILALVIPQPSFGEPLNLPETLKEQLKKLVTEYPSEFGVRIDDIARGETVFAGNQDAPLNPASVMKLVTTKAAIDLLGVGFRWKTEILIDGALQGKSLTGDLYFRGGGDPTLDLMRFKSLLKNIYDLGIHSINGNVYVDRSIFPTERHDPSLFDNEPWRPYNAGPDALLINANVFDVRFIPNQETKTVDLISSPSNINIINELKLVDQPCTKWPKKPVIMQGQIVFQGAYPASCGIKQRQYNFLAPSVYFENIFLTEWTALGGVINGQILDKTTPESAQELLSIQSEPLASALRLTNKWSSNVAARNIFLTLSLQPNTASDIAASRSIINDWAIKRGFNTEGFFIDNGSGLSRSARVSASLISEILNAAWIDASMPEFVSSFSIPGVDGTLETRFTHSIVNARAHLKTGSLEDVRSIAGYLHLSNGRTLSIVIIMNSGTLTKNPETLEHLVESLYDTQ